MKQTESFKWLLGSQYFLYFGVLGVFLPYFNLYCYHLGFNGFQIGVLSGVRSMSLVLFPILWGMAADRFQARRSIYIFCNFFSAVIWIFFLFTTDFYRMFWITLVYGICFAPIISFMETFTMEALGPEKRGYGRVRVWGTIAFISVVTIMGRVIDRFSVEIILKVILIGALIQAVISIRIPRTRGAGKPSVIGADPGFLFRPRALIFMLCAFLMLVSHGTYYGFLSIHLEALGCDGTFIGMVWALASGAETLVMFNSTRIFKRFSLEKVLIFSCMIAVLRWTILSATQSPGVIMASQVLHAFTYASFHIACILYMDDLAPEKSKTLAQGVINAMTYGLGMMTGFLLNGYFYESLGPFRMFMISGGIALVSGGMFGISRMIK